MLKFLGDFRTQALVLHRCCFVILLNDTEVHVFVTHGLVVAWLHVTEVLLDGWLWWRALIDGRWKGYVTGFELQHPDVWPDLICVDWHGSSALEEPRHPNAQEHIEVLQNAYSSSQQVYIAQQFLIGIHHFSMHHERGGWFCHIVVPFQSKKTFRIFYNAIKCIVQSYCTGYFYLITEFCSALWEE